MMPQLPHNASRAFLRDAAKRAYELSTRLLAQLISVANKRVGSIGSDASGGYSNATESASANCKGRVLRRHAKFNIMSVVAATEFELGLVSTAMCHPATGVEVKDRATWPRRNAKNSFTGEDAVTWMIKRNVVDNRATGRKLGELLVGVGFVSQVRSNTKSLFKDAPKSLYRFPFLDSPWPAHTAGTVAGLAREGKFDAIHTVPALVDFSLNVRELCGVHAARMPDGPMKMAFWLNVHNMLHLHARLTTPPPAGITDQYGWMKRVAYVVGGERYTLLDMEHAVLRAHGRRPSVLASFLLPRFSRQDARRGSAVKPFDSRVNFLLCNYYSVSPSVRVFHHDKLETEIMNATKNFIRRRVVINDKHVLLPSVPFSYYLTDFAATAMSLPAELARYMTDGQRASLQKLRQKKGKKVKVKFVSAQFEPARVIVPNELSGLLAIA